MDEDALPELPDLEPIPLSEMDLSGPPRYWFEPPPAPACSQEDDIETLLYELETELFFSDVPVVDTNTLPDELREKTAVHFDWNEYLIPELKYRMRVVLAEEWGVECEKRIASVNFILCRMAWWLFHVETTGAIGWDAAQEAKEIAAVVDRLGLTNLGDSFARVLDYNLFDTAPKMP